MFLGIIYIQVCLVKLYEEVCASQTKRVGENNSFYNSRSSQKSCSLVYPLKIILKQFDRWNIINLSLKYGIFQDNLKIAKVIPIFKPGFHPHTITVASYQFFQHFSPFKIFWYLKNTDLLLKRIHSELPAIYKWLCSNRLALNLSKTKQLVFHQRQKVNSNFHSCTNCRPVY